LLAAKVALVLGVLVLANLAVAWGGVRAVAVTDQQADKLYSEHLLEVRDQSDLSQALDQAYQDTLRLIPTNLKARQVELERRLDEQSIPAVDRALAAVEREEADEEPSVRALVQRLREGWQRFLRLHRSGKFVVTGSTRQVALFNDALVKEVARTFEPSLAALEQLTDHEFEQAQRAQDLSHTTYLASRRLIVAILLGSVAAAIAVAMWLTRDIVRRIRDYAAFATKVTDGEGTRPLGPRGSDELAELGHSLNQMLGRQQANALAGAAQTEFIEMLQVTVGEEEAHDLVKRHLERSIGDSSVVVLNRNNSADRLEPATALAPDSPMVAALDGATPRSCLALRFARTHQEDPTRPPLVACQLCAVTGRSTCEPLLVGG